MQGLTRERAVDDMVRFSLELADEQASGSRSAAEVKAAVEDNEALLRGFGYTQPQIDDMRAAAQDIIIAMHMDLRSL